jgi:hypothetical protein
LIKIINCKSSSKKQHYQIKPNFARMVLKC